MFRKSLLLIAVVASALSFVAVNAQEETDVCDAFAPIIFCESKDGTPCGDLKRRGINAGNCEEKLVIKVKIRNSSNFAATLNSQTVEFTGPGFTNIKDDEDEDQTNTYVYENEALRIPKKINYEDGELVREYEKTVDLCKMSFNVQLTKARFWVNEAKKSCGMTKTKTFVPVPFCSMESKIECKIGGLPCKEEPEEECGLKSVNYVYSMCNHNPNGEITTWKKLITAKIRDIELVTTSSFVAEAGACTTIIENTIPWEVDTCEKQLPHASLKIYASPDTDDVQNCFAYTFMGNPFKEDEEEDKDEKEKDDKDHDNKDKEEKDDKDHDNKEKDDKDHDNKDKDNKDDKKDNKDHDKKEFEVRRNMRGSRQ